MKLLSASSFNGNLSITKSETETKLLKLKWIENGRHVTLYVTPASKSVEGVAIACTTLWGPASEVRVLCIFDKLSVLLLNKIWNILGKL